MSPTAQRYLLLSQQSSRLSAVKTTEVDSVVNAAIESYAPGRVAFTLLPTIKISAPVEILGEIWSFVRTMFLQYVAKEPRYAKALNNSFVSKRAGGILIAVPESVSYVGMTKCINALVLAAVEHFRVRAQNSLRGLRPNASNNKRWLNALALVRVVADMQTVPVVRLDGSQEDINLVCNMIRSQPSSAAETDDDSCGETD